MAMAVDDRAAAQLWWHKSGRLAREELIEQQRIGRELLRARQAREERGQLVAKGQDAARLEADDLDPALGEGRQRLERVAHPDTRAVQHPLIIERPSAANIARRQDDVEARAFEYRGRGDADLRLKEIVEG